MADAPKNDDFDAAFAQFAAPDDKQPADAAAAGAEEKKPEAAAAGGENDQGVDGADAGKSDGADAGGADGGTGAADDAGEQKGKEADGAGAEDGGAGEGGADAGGEAAADDAADDKAKSAAADTGPSPDDILAGLKKLVGDVGVQAAEGGDQKPAGQDKKEEPKPIYSADEEAFLKDYDKDWETVAKGEALKRRAEYQQLLDYIFTQVADFVKPIHETAEAIADRTFRSELKTSVPDYSNELRQSVVDWTKTQPTYLQVAYNHVITEGSVDEVKDLIDRYRASTGQAKPNGSGAVKKTGKENELSDEAKKAAAQLAPVDSKRSGVQAPSDPSNFDDAWKLAAKELEEK